MANDDKLDVQLNLITSGAGKALDGFSKSFKNTFGGLNADLGKTTLGLGKISGGFGLAATAAIGAAAAVAGFFASKQILQGAIAQEEAVNSVAIALARTGEFSKESLAEMEDWASQLQKNTVYADDEILKQASLALAFGATKDQAKDVTKAAIELAAATGKTLDEATNTVAKTLGGMAGELGKINPRIKALTAEQLKNGEAVRILLEQYGGTAIGKINTFGGALAQSKNVFGDLLDSIGMLITKNPVVVEAIKSMTDIFGQLATYLDANRDSIIKFINDGLVRVIEFAPQVGAFFKVVVESLTILAKSLSIATAGVGVLVQSFLSFQIIADLFDHIVHTIGQIIGGLSDLFSILVKLPGVSDTLEAMGVNTDNLAASLEQAAISSYNMTEAINAEKINAGIEKANEFAFSIADGAEEVKNNLNKAIDAGVVKAGKLAAAVKGISNKGQVQLKVVNNTESVKASIDNYQQLLETAFGGSTGGKIAGTLISSIATGLKSGKEGARAMISSLSGAVADAFLPGLGAVVGPLVDALSQGPDAVREMVKQFVGSVPELIENIILAIPVLIEEFANQIPLVVERMAERSDEIIIALAKAMPKVALALALAQPKVALALAKEMPKAALSFIQSLVKGAVKFVSAMVQAIGDAVKSVLGIGKGGGTASKIPVIGKPIQSGLDSVKSGINSVTKHVGIKFSKGGEVPDGFPNDSLSTRLSSRELVVDRSTTGKLKNFLDGGTGTTDVLLLKMLNLLEKPQTVSTSFKLNNREFANAILQLSRTQQRTS